jgi:propionyl-CoA carboxylase alpha chain
MGDKHGTVLYLNERECSIQRRNQKVIEEAPSPFLDAATRKAMGEQAVQLAKAVGYDSAGTVEFIVDKNRNFYFLEMNTRLQVEHPVTELTTGLDLVELMIRSAAGEKLPLTQKDVKLNGWAVEARVYAEDPHRGFLPSTGRLVRYQPPPEGERGDIIIRNDTGVYEGGEISIYYDPMIAKLCTHAPTRIAAIDAMAAALDDFTITGISHNIAFLDAIMHNTRFRSGNITTAFIAEEYPDGFHGRPLDDAMMRRFVAAAVAAKLMRTTRASAISGTLNGAHHAAAEFIAKLNGAYGDKPVAVNEAHINEGRLFLRIDGTPFSAATDWHPGMPVMHLREKDQEYAIQIERIAGGNRLRQGGAHATITVRSPHAAELAALMPKKKTADTSKFLLCPMPGLVVSVNVKEGQDVKAGESLAVVEAMKMENVLTAERDSKVKKVNAKKGDSLALDDVIIEFA